MTIAAAPGRDEGTKAAGGEADVREGKVIKVTKVGRSRVEYEVETPSGQIVIVKVGNKALRTLSSK